VLKYVQPFEKCGGNMSGMTFAWIVHICFVVFGVAIWIFYKNNKDVM
jgi:hypothetical protein